MNMRRVQKEETRGRILEAAVTLFEAETDGEVKLKDIAAAAGVSIPTLLFHFGSRVQLLSAIGEELVAKAQSEWPQPWLGCGTLEAVKRYLHPRSARTARAIWRVGDEITWLSPETTEPHAQRFRDRLREHLLQDGFSKKDAEVLADLLAPGVLMTGRRMTVNRAPERLARRFLAAVRQLLETWEAQEEAEPEVARPLVAGGRRR